MENLPKSCIVDKIIPKDSFKSISDLLTKHVNRIRFLSNISEQTINIKQNDQLDAIAIIQIDVKDNVLQSQIFKTINEIITSNVLFKITFNNEYTYAFYDQILFVSEWNQQVIIDYNSPTLDKLYDSMRLQIINHDYKNTDYTTKITNIIKVEELNNKILVLDKNRKQEKQLNKKNEIRKEMKNIEELIKEING
ncbi:MAG: DUF4391 domain-containing protein [Mycoplasmatales bacterium]